MKKTHTMKVKGRRTLKFSKRFFMSDWAMLHTSKKYVIVGLLSHDPKGEITYFVKEKEDRQPIITNVDRMNISWRRLKKRLIADYTRERYKRFY